MNPSQVIETLNMIGKKSESGLVMTRQTLLRYEWQGLIPKSDRGSKGRGQGRWTEYSAETVEQAFAAWMLIHGRYENITGGLFFEKPPKIPPVTVAIIRKSYFDREGFFVTWKAKMDEVVTMKRQIGRGRGLSQTKEIVRELARLPEEEREAAMVKLDWLFLDLCDADIKERELNAMLKNSGINIEKASAEFGVDPSSAIAEDAFGGLIKAFVDIYDVLLVWGCEFKKGASKE